MTSSSSGRNERVAIFGATSEIATHVARQLAPAGVRFVLIGRNAEALGSAAQDLSVRGAQEVKVQVADLADLGTIDVTADTAWNALGGLDVALIAYGTLPDQTAAESDISLAREALALNLSSPALLSLRLAGHFERQRSGVLAVITSVAGDRGRRSNYLYGAAKGGLQRLLEGLRHRLFSVGVQVLDIRPGFVSTRMTAHIPQRGLLWAQPHRVASDILRGVHKNRAVLYTPWFWTWIMMGVRNLPRSVVHRSTL